MAVFWKLACFGLFVGYEMAPLLHYGLDFGSLDFGGFVGFVSKRAALRAEAT